MRPLMRICPPSRYDPAPYKTICYVEGEDGVDGYIQVSKDHETPHWVPMGDFLYKVFRDKLSDDKFIDTCFGRYYE
jgi:hypothetical protein